MIDSFWAYVKVTFHHTFVITLNHPTLSHHYIIPHPTTITPSLTDTLNRHYQPTSLLVLVSENEEYARLFNELLVILEPLIHLPFSFSIDFELRQVGNVWVCGIYLKPPYARGSPWVAISLFMHGRSQQRS